MHRMSMRGGWWLAMVVLMAATAANAVPKKFVAAPSEGGFVASEAQPVVAVANSSDKEPRFGFAFPGGMQNNNGNGNGNSIYPGYGNGMINLDLGGLILGAVVGLGAVFVLPKLLHIFTNQHDHYRSLADLGTSQHIAQALRKVDAALAENKIESSACAQRALCTYTKQAARAVASGRAGAMDSLLDLVTGDSIMGTVLQGSALKKAADLGRAGGGCGHTYTGCPLTTDALLATAKTLMGDLIPAE